MHLEYEIRTGCDPNPVVIGCWGRSGVGPVDL